MSYSSGWISVPGATAWVIIGLIVACCTLGSICRITGPPRWISPRTGGFSCSSLPRPGAPESLRRRPGRPFLPPQPVGPCAQPRCRLHRPQRCLPASRRERVPPALAEVLGHRLHVRGVQAQFLRDLPVGEVQPPQVEAQNPHAQWLMVPAQHRAGQIVEASMARLAQVALPVPLSFVMAIADDHGIVAVRAAHASWPTMLTHKLKTLGLVQQPREIDHLRYRYACAASKTTRSRLHPIRSETWLQRYPARATTPEPNKSLQSLTLALMTSLLPPTAK